MKKLNETKVKELPTYVQKQLQFVGVNQVKSSTIVIINYAGSVYCYSIVLSSYTCFFLYNDSIIVYFACMDGAFTI
ncbi:hypothetical protein QNH47_10025 [Virgibacillus halodenitrificans]|uniref:hypothetical protein n=1 Tax=Virgibacillus halodenitrificans TaxID=1482 RepID=UPI0024C0CE38|nr:hypothetical protein [Virgibacillus halodenitrificans]WHX24536.1 hypothetical protein QNH47_10025 [Virgibacillus halodenitrificans]